MDDRLTEADTDEIELYKAWFAEVKTDEWTRPEWFLAETQPISPADVPSRPKRYIGRHRRTWRHRVRGLRAALQAKAEAFLDWAYRVMFGV